MNAYRMEKGKLLTLVLVAACLIGVCFASFGTDVDAADGKVVEYTISESSKGDGAVISNGTESKEYTYVKPGIGFSTESTIVISDSEKLGANDTLKVTMTGGKIGELVLVYVVDKVDNTYDIEFTMSGGTITAGLYATCGDTISGYESSKSGAIGTWDDPSLSADSVTLNFNGGKVHGIQPNINLNRVQEYNVNVSGNAEIDMLKTSGSNGRVDDINVSITSGHVGYITAVRTETETISYDITGGQIDYFAIVADSEGGSYGVNQSNTAYITGNIDVSISDNVVVKQIILGSGAVDAPNKLWNSTSSTEVKPSAQSGTVTIDAPGHTIYVQQAFYDEAGKAYQLYTYIIGDTNIQTSNVDTSKFGENGVWMGVDMFDAKKTLVLRAGELFMPEGSQYSGDIVFGDGSSSLSMKNIKAGESGIRMSVGSVAISGDVFTNGDGSLTVRGGGAHRRSQSRGPADRPPRIQAHCSDGDRPLHCRGCDHNQRRIHRCSGIILGHNRQHIRKHQCVSRCDCR